MLAVLTFRERRLPARNASPARTFAGLPRRASFFRYLPLQRFNDSMFPHRILLGVDRLPAPITSDENVGENYSLQFATLFISC